MKKMCVLCIGVRRGGQEGPPFAGQNSMFFDFLIENSLFLSIFRQIVCFCPLLENFALLWKKVSWCYATAKLSIKKYKICDSEEKKFDSIGIWHL